MEDYLLEEKLNVQREGYEAEIFELEDQISKMQSFFDKLSQPIINKSVRHVISQVRKIPTECINGYYEGNLDFFENVCLIQQDAFFLHHYLSVLEILNRCCIEAYENLTTDEKFIVNNTGLDDNKKMVFNNQNGLLEFEGVILIANAFTYLASNFTNKKIRDIRDL